MKKIKLKKETIKRERFSAICPFCNGLIKGISIKHLIGNMDIHLSLKHKNINEKVEIVEE